MPVNITTATDLISHDDYLNSLPKNSHVNIVLSGEPMTDITLGSPLPSNKRMLVAYDKLKQHGISVSVYAPEKVRGKTLTGLKELDPFTLKKVQQQKNAYWKPSAVSENE
jgi:hypothetical protein